MKKSRKIQILLILISLLIPINVGYLYYDYLEDAALMAENQFLNDDDENLLTDPQKHTKIFQTTMIVFILFILPNVFGEYFSICFQIFDRCLGLPNPTLRC